MKRVYQWISIKADDLAAGRVKIQNRYAFISLDGFDGRWTLSEDGTVIDQGKLEKLNLAPGAERVVTVPFKKFQPKAGASYHLRVAFTPDVRVSELGPNSTVIGGVAAGLEFARQQRAPSAALHPLASLWHAERSSI